MKHYFSRFITALSSLFLLQGQAVGQADNKPISADFPYQAHFVEVLGSRMHYVDEGQGDPILFLHGNPTSSYLWRNIIPYAAEHGRAIAVDLIGMGKSDKPDIEYSFLDHVRYIEGFIEALNLQNITLVIHDWGSGIGFQYASQHEDNVRAIAFMEAIYRERDSMGALFDQFRTPETGWQLLVEQNVFIEQVLPGSVVRGLTEEEMTAYRAPFLEPSSRKPIWKWPNELPLGGHPAETVAAINAYQGWLVNSSLPKLLFTAEPGVLITPQDADWLRQNLKNLRVVDIGPGRHYIQEDNPHKIGEELARWYQSL
ncbi:MAG: haloalkane dehalogenase [Pseudomonadales bacterium]|nr:haloalkane dehalogenase [Pseudomonadales bacterium]